MKNPSQELKRLKLQVRAAFGLAVVSIAVTAALLLKKGGVLGDGIAAAQVPSSQLLATERKITSAAKYRAFGVDYGERGEVLHFANVHIVGVLPTKFGPPDRFAVHSAATAKFARTPKSDWVEVYVRSDDGGPLGGWYALKDDYADTLFDPPDGARYDITGIAYRYGGGERGFVPQLIVTEVKRVK